jgi:hypothetical protein
MYSWKPNKKSNHFIRHNEESFQALFSKYMHYTTTANTALCTNLYHYFDYVNKFTFSLSNHKGTIKQYI